MRTRVLAAALLAAALVVAASAHASTEQFASFDVYQPENDDESMIDYILSRPLDDWRDEWEQSTSALRADQGCMTAATWYQDNEFKTRSRMGDSTALAVDFLQHTDPGGSYQWLSFDVLHATRLGAFGGRFRPAYEKSQQDFAALWVLGNGRSPLEIHATLAIEDMFNKLWTFRQASVGEAHLEPYRQHPFEPALDVIWRGARHRLQLSDTWLTPSRQDIVDPDPSLAGTRTLQGNHAFALGERSFGAWTGIARYECTSARSSRTLLAQPGDGRSDRQQWSAEMAIRRTLTSRLVAEGHYAYMRRAEDWRPPGASGTFVALDRIGHASLAWQASDHWQFRTGLLYDRVGVSRNDVPPGFSYGSRKESRAYVGVQARLGRVRVQAVEGIELDAEPYEVSFHHDKGFLHLQTTF